MKKRPHRWSQSHVETPGHTGISLHVRCHSRRAHPLADHRAEVRIAVELAQRDLTGGDEAEEEQERTVMQSSGAFSPRATRPSRHPFQAS